MKKEFIIGGSIGIIFIIAIIIGVVVSKKTDNKEVEFIPVIAEITSVDNNGNIIESDEKVKLENDDKSKIKEYAKQICETAKNERYSMIIFTDYNIRVSEHISIKIKSDIKEYVYYVDDTKEGSEKEIVTRAPEGFVDWVMSKVKPNQK